MPTPKRYILATNDCHIVACFKLKYGV